MEKAERERIIIPDENGDEHLFEVLFTFDVEETGKSYMVLIAAGDEENDEEEVEVHAFRYEEKGDGDDDLSLHPIETDEEWDMVEEMLNTFSEGEEE
ncbi:hypothetical protein BKP45_04770 [Anaerobacillus alkalidiazotrophicus]|uniref:UPF0473 protein BKP45_04770 n=2 Tax=Anaerobacillus TaxID=704093 RepID=A0A1S2MC24_9BACI|nr:MULTISPECIES: DUF1292 domain-containing protein [Anaerobacillus]OIJ16620.1 hypothetical protein BKP37_05140 [Anaerobacillus alkalilacustris]OIJ21993.1 hypothetical protein BKP45_04770 [Anaerobacillus alkalidiazotrophicus]